MIASFEDERRGKKPRDVGSLEAKETDSFLKPPERILPCLNLDFDSV